MSNRQFYDFSTGQWLDKAPEGWFWSNKDNAWHTLPKPESLADLSVEQRRNVLEFLLSDYEVTEQQRAEIFKRYNC